MDGVKLYYTLVTATAYGLQPMIHPARQSCCDFYV